MKRKVVLRFPSVTVPVLAEEESPKAPALCAEPQQAFPPPQRAPAPAACRGTQLDNSFSACTAKMVTRMPGGSRGEQPLAEAHGGQAERWGVAVCP